MFHNESQVDTSHINIEGINNNKMNGDILGGGRSSKSVDALEAAK